MEIRIFPFRGNFMFLNKSYISTHKKFYASRQISDLKSYLKSLSQCRMCSIRGEAQRVVLPEYNYLSDLLFVARNPGRQEDLVGRPLYPNAPGGKWFHKYLDVMGMRRESVSVSNALFCHTLKDRPPTPHELTICSRWKIFEFYFLFNLKYIILMGNDAVRQYLGLGHISIAKEGFLGTFYQCNMFGRKFMVFPVHHPAYVLRNSSKNPQIIKDNYSVLEAASRLIDMDREDKLKWVI